METINGSVQSATVSARDLGGYIGKTVRFHGIVHKIREMSGFAFVIVRSGSTLTQCVYSNEISDFDLSILKEEAAVVFLGEIVADQRSRAGYEARLLQADVLSSPESQMPVVINGKQIDATLETLLDYRPLTLRNERERAIFAVQDGLCQGLRRFFADNSFKEIHSPKIVSGGAEGGANIFSLDYFGKSVFLAQSPQFYKQAMVAVFERVYEIAPVFRAEKHDTSRHVNEYTSVDFEMGFIESYRDVMRMEVAMLRDAFRYLKESCSAEIALLKAEIPEIGEIPVIAFSEAKSIIEAAYKREITDFEDFEPEEERLLCELVKKQTGCDFVFVTRYKSSKRPFYAMDSADNPEFTESFDLLFRGVEVTTGGQRVHDYANQVAKMLARGMNPDLFSSYLMAHKHGLPPHGGLGLGLERLTAALLGFANVRRATLFPRDINRLEP